MGKCRRSYNAAKTKILTSQMRFASIFISQDSLFDRQLYCVRHTSTSGLEICGSGTSNRKLLQMLHKLTFGPRDPYHADSAAEGWPVT